MTVEMKVEEAQVVEVIDQTEGVKVVEEVVKVVEEGGVVEKFEAADKPEVIEKSSSFKEESNYLSDLKEHERKALSDLKAKLEEAILGNNLFKKEEEKAAEEKKKKAIEEEKKDGEAKEGGECEKATEEEAAKEELKSEEAAGEEKVAQVCEEEKKTDVEEVKIDEEKAEEEKKTEVTVEEKCEEIDRDISIWGVPLLPSKGDESTDVVLLKFLRAREFKVNDAFEMLKKTLQWRKELKIDSILDEDLGTDLVSAAYMNGVDREGHPVCYNIYGVFDDQELYQKTFGSVEKREQFLRWRFQLMEKGIEKLDLKPGGVCSILQITDLKNSPGPSKKLRVASKQAVALLQDNYPEFVAKNIFVNVPFWMYTFHALLAPFLTLRTKSKILFARPAKVTETLLKYIPAEEIPVQYGGFKRENDFEFSCEENSVSEVTIKAGSTETIEISTPEVGKTVLWDLTVLGWEVNYKEEFVPADEGSYTIVIQKGKKITSHEEPIRNSFRNSEPGKIVITIENGSSKKKRVLYRYKNPEERSP